MTIVYNATTASASPPGNGNAPGSNAAGKPDLAVQVQVFRDNEPVVTDPLHNINTDGATDLARIPYAAELNLEGLAPRKVRAATHRDRSHRQGISFTTRAIPG